MIYDYLNEKVDIDPGLCFVIMPFQDAMESVFLNGIKPAVDDLGLRCERADQNISSSPILFQVYDQILRANLIIADITSANPNVYYELGICHVLKRDIILLKSKGDEVPFDLQGFRQQDYEDTPEGLISLREFLRTTVKTIIDRGEFVKKDKSEEVHLLNKAFEIWEKTHVVILRFEEFLQIVLALDDMNVSENKEAFLAYASAYFGKFMKKMVERTSGNVLAIRLLVAEAATGIMTRVPWRAAAMLERSESEIVRRETESFAAQVINDDIFPDSILEKKVLMRLKSIINSRELSRETYDKLAEVVRQIELEFCTSEMYV